MQMTVSKEMINRVKTFIKDELDAAERCNTRILVTEYANKAYGALCFLSSCGDASVEDELERWWSNTVEQKFIDAISKKRT